MLLCNFLSFLRWIWHSSVLKVKFTIRNKLLNSHYLSLGCFKEQRWNNQIIVECNMSQIDLGLYVYSVFQDSEEKVFHIYWGQRIVWPFCETVYKLFSKLWSFYKVLEKQAKCAVLSFNKWTFKHLDLICIGFKKKSCLGRWNSKLFKLLLEEKLTAEVLFHPMIMRQPQITEIDCLRLNDRWTSLGIKGVNSV